MPTATAAPAHQPHPVIRYINFAITILLAASAAAVYWFVYRPLPRTSGTIQAPLAQRVTITRDALGVPHISAASEDDALFAQGYVTAQDRLFQMDGLRRLAAGDLSEIVGPAALEVDRDSRRLRMRRIAEAAYATLPAQDRAPLAAYARGVNYFIETHLHGLPIEFTLLGYHPRPWSVVDTILIGLHMYRDLTTTWKDEILKRNMLAAGDRAKVDFLFPPRSGGELQPGSNAWAISGAHTASGKPILCNDMHLEYSIPGIWYMVHLKAPGLDVSGVSLPGAPSVIVGHNQRIAWGVTNLHFDVQDLYIENFDPATGRYLYRGQWEQARREREIIPVKGAPAVEMPLWVTRHGPLYIDDAREHLALRWAAAEPGAFQFPFPELNRAGNWQEFTRALARFPGPAQNFAYADVDGNIGYHATGRLPIRKGYTGDLPVDGSSGENEWQGFIPFEELPSFFNPPQGVIVTANQNPFPPDYPYAVNGNFASHYRSRRIRDLLLARNGWRARDMLSVQQDVYSAFSHYLAQAIVAAFDAHKSKQAGMQIAVQLLRGWNGQMDKDAAAPLVVTLAYEHLKKFVAESAAPNRGATQNAYKYQMAPAVIESLLRTRPPAWVNDWDETLLRSLAQGLEDGRHSQGRDPARWTYGKYEPLLLANPVGRHLPLVAGLFNIGPVPMSGSPTTVKQYTDALGPSMRLDADLADWDRSLLEGTTGQSGQVLSRHYKDEWERYYNAQSFPMQFRNVQAKDVLMLTP
ncbi:MAG TPA: penicillin acylase family protein [Bryobacteraceae bacterium]|nr:penicillin acylase family protein [Bryobacteraceae bacterium]